MKLFIPLILVMSLILSSCSGLFGSKDLPKGFVYLADVSADIKQDIKYYSKENFVGKRIEGYKEPVAITTSETAKALQAVQKELAEKKLTLIIYDAYRPQKAVNQIMAWAKDLSDTLNKDTYYPNVKKSDLIKLNYIMEKSAHSRGSSVDVSIVDENGKELDMGTPFDYFGSRSWPSSRLVTPKQKENRMMLQFVMVKNGFTPYKEEWWHFTLQNEPFPDTYFDFDVE